MSAQEQERAVGITAFVSPDAPGFQCTIKHRYTDFLVNEISSDGTVLHLTTDRVESKKKQRQPEDIEGLRDGSAADKRKLHETSSDQQAEDGSSSAKKQRVGEMNEEITKESEQQESNTDRKAEIVSSISDADKSRLHGIFGESTTTQILSLYANIVMRPDRKPRDHPTIRSEVISDKATRTAAHIATREIFASKLSTEMLQDSPGVIAIKAAPAKGPSGPRGQPNGDGNGARQKGRMGWDELGGEYLHFTLYKENKDTMEVLYFLATQLKVPARNFQFAGTKDRRGVTVQRVAIFRVHADRVAQLNRVLRGSRVGNFEYQKHGLDLGELHGNEFLLTLRECRFEGDESLAIGDRKAHAAELVGQACTIFKQRGYLNYFGQQRFGTYSTGTHATGMKMLKGDLEGAIDSILTYPESLLPENVDSSGTAKVPQDDINRADAIRLWRERGLDNEASSRLPRRFQAESAIMQYLGKKDRKTGKLLQDKDWQGALMMIQRNLRLMYVHAYQSLVWNTVASKRWEVYGGKVVEGDLVIVGEKDGGVSVKKDEVDEDGEPIFHPAADDSAPSAEDSFTRARHLSKEEAESGEYDIFDIVLPLPGFDVLYPANEIGKFYEDFMASEAGGGLDPHNMRRAWKDISLSGDYRKMLARPGEGFGFEVKTYGMGEEQMVETDLGRLQKRSAVDNATTTDQPLDGSKTADGDDKIAVILKLQLGSSQYATMALRELTKGGAVNYKPDFSSR